MSSPLSELRIYTYLFLAGLCLENRKSPSPFASHRTRLNPTSRYVISLLANLNARKRSDAPVVHGSDNNQAAPATKLSTVVFSPANRHTLEGGNESIAASFPVQSIAQMNSQNGSNHSNLMDGSLSRRF